jgi:hypothetical protein
MNVISRKRAIVPIHSALIEAMFLPDGARIVAGKYNGDRLELCVEYDKFDEVEEGTIPPTKIIVHEMVKRFEDVR